MDPILVGGRAGARSLGTRDEMLLDGRVAVITGARSGIGREIAALFAGEGARIAAVDNALEAGEQLVAGLGDDAFFVHGDVRDPAGVDRRARRSCGRAGRIDVLVSCAGRSEVGDVYELPPRSGRTSSRST